MSSETEEYVALFYSDDKLKRKYGAEKLGELGRDGVEAAKNLLSDSDWHIRYRACEAIGFAKVGAEFLYPMLSDEKDHVRYMAVKSLGFCKTADLEERISPLADDENEFVRRIVGKVLGSQ
ncbi:MAG: HEAT repeat domain-containing protein [Methanocorpusculum sp.]|nr:HEAT repeat domain-containing protein [Methanocorpusculum sp.]